MDQKALKTRKLKLIIIAVLAAVVIFLFLAQLTHQLQLICQLLVQLKLSFRPSCSV